MDVSTKASTAAVSTVDVTDSTTESLCSSVGTNKNLDVNEETLAHCLAYSLIWGIGATLDGRWVWYGADGLSSVWVPFVLFGALSCFYCCAGGWMSWENSSTTCIPLILNVLGFLCFFQALSAIQFHGVGHLQAVWRRSQHAIFRNTHGRLPKCQRKLVCSDRRVWIWTAQQLSCVLPTNTWGMSSCSPSTALVWRISGLPLPALVKYASTILSIGHEPCYKCIEFCWVFSAEDVIHGANLLCVHPSYNCVTHYKSFHSEDYRPHQHTWAFLLRWRVATYHCWESNSFGIPCRFFGMLCWWTTSLVPSILSCWWVTEEWARLVWWR